MSTLACPNQPNTSGISLSQSRAREARMRCNVLSRCPSWRTVRKATEPDDQPHLRLHYPKPLHSPRTTAGPASPSDTCAHMPPFPGPSWSQPSSVAAYARTHVAGSAPDEWVGLISQRSKCTYNTSTPFGVSHVAGVSLSQRV
jgi:hypothetical protein